MGGRGEPGDPSPGACASSSLSASFGGQGATQAIIGGVTITNDARTACRLNGRPAIAIRTASPVEKLRELPWASGAFPDTRFHETVLLKPQRSAAVFIRWMNWCKPRASPSSPPADTAQGIRPSRILVTTAPGTQPIRARVAGGLRHLGLPDWIAPSRPSAIDGTPTTP